LLGFGESLLSPVCYYFIINSKNFFFPISWGDKSNKLFLLHQTFFKVFPTIFFPSDNEGFVSVYFVRPGFQRTCFSFKAGAKVGIIISPPNLFQCFLKIVGERALRNDPPQSDNYKEEKECTALQGAWSREHEAESPGHGAGGASVK
jgi:hypothetical protein